MIKKFATAFAALAIAGAAHADYAGQATGTTSNANFTETANGSGLLTFTLDGYGSIDGFDNCCTDKFTVMNGSTVVFDGYFNLGGGGSTKYNTFLAGTVITDIGGSTANGNVTWTGGELTFVIPVSYVAGGNSFTFAYSSPTGIQGLGDEGWAVSNTALTTLAVPEAGSMAMLLAGLGIIGGLARRRNRA